ncbi:MAG: hypothetical protein V4565_08685 [Bacteroidota bacterium]
MTDTSFISTYFTEEKISASIMIVIGSVSLILSLFFLLIIKYSFFKGMAFPLLLLGMLQVCVGAYIVGRSPKDIVRVNHQFKMEPQKLKTHELPRMKKVLWNFVIYKWIEVILILIGTILMIAFYKSTQTFWKGFGLGLLLQSGIIFTLDSVAEKRAEHYVNILSQLT